MLAVAKNFEEVLHYMFGFWDSERWWYFIGAVCTIAIVTYIFRDNVLFRVAEHVMIGLAVGYTIVVTFYAVGVKEVLTPIFVNGSYVLIIPSILGIMLALRVFPKLSWVSRFPLAMMVGAGVGQGPTPRVAGAGIQTHILIGPDRFYRIGRPGDIARLDTVRREHRTRSRHDMRPDLLLLLEAAYGGNRRGCQDRSDCHHDRLRCLIRHDCPGAYYPVRQSHVISS